MLWLLDSVKINHLAILGKHMLRDSIGASISSIKVEAEIMKKKSRGAHKAVRARYNLKSDSKEFNPRTVLPTSVLLARSKFLRPSVPTPLTN